MKIALEVNRNELVMLGHGLTVLLCQFPVGHNYREKAVKLQERIIEMLREIPYEEKG